MNCDQWIRTWSPQPTPQQCSKFNQIATDDWECKENWGDPPRRPDGRETVVLGCNVALGRGMNAPRFDPITRELVCSYWPTDNERNRWSEDLIEHCMIGYGEPDPNVFTPAPDFTPTRIRAGLTFRWGFKMRIDLIPDAEKGGTLFTQIHGEGECGSFFWMKFYPHKWQVVVDDTRPDRFIVNDPTRPVVGRWYDFEILVFQDDYSNAVVTDSPTLLVHRDGDVIAERFLTWDVTDKGVLARGPHVGIYANWARYLQVDVPQYLHFKDIYFDILDKAG